MTAAETTEKHERERNREAGRHASEGHAQRKEEKGNSEGEINFVRFKDSEFSGFVLELGQLAQQCLRRCDTMSENTQKPALGINQAGARLSFARTDLRRSGGFLMSPMSSSVRLRAFSTRSHACSSVC